MPLGVVLPVHAPLLGVALGVIQCQAPTTVPTAVALFLQRVPHPLWRQVKLMSLGQVSGLVGAQLFFDVLDVLSVQAGASVQIYVREALAACYCCQNPLPISVAVIPLQNTEGLVDGVPLRDKPSLGVRAKEVLVRVELLPNLHHVLAFDHAVLHSILHAMDQHLVLVIAIIA